MTTVSLAANHVRQSLLLLKYAEKSKGLERFRITYALTILQNFLLLANQAYRDQISDDTIQILTDIGDFAIMKNERRRTPIVRHLRNAVAHFTFELTQQSSNVAQISFLDDKRRSIMISEKNLIPFTEKFGVYLLGVIEASAVKPPVSRPKPTKNTMQPLKSK